MSNPSDDNRGKQGDLRVDGGPDRNATLMRLVAEGLRIEEGEFPSWRTQVEELYRAAASQAARVGPPN